MKTLRVLVVLATLAMPAMVSAGEAPATPAAPAAVSMAPVPPAPPTAANLLDAIFAEMRRQVEDSRRSFDAAGEIALQIAASLRRTGRLVLLGMGGSHSVNRPLR